MQFLEYNDVHYISQLKRFSSFNNKKHVIFSSDIE